MEHFIKLLLLCVCLANAVHGAVYSPGGGGVYGDSSPKDAGGDPVFAVLPSQDVNPDYYTTQTVYGFLDFTTTIGNTVMIFSPQSAAPAVTEPPKTTAPPPPVIETTPTTTTTTEEVVKEIKPSKTVVLPVQPKEKVSIVQVLPETPKPPTTKPIGPLKFVPKAVPKVAIKPILKPKPKIVEVAPVKAEAVPQQEQPQADRFIVKPVPKSVIIKPVAPIVKVVATKVEPTTTTTPENDPAVESEEEEEEDFEQEQEQEVQEVAEEEHDEQHDEEEQEEEEEEEEEQQHEQEQEQEQQQQEPSPVANVAVEAVQVTEKPKMHVVEAVKPVTAASTTTTTTEEPVAVVNAAEDQHEEHSPIMFSNISEDEVKPVAGVKDAQADKSSPVAGTDDHQQQNEETPEDDTNAEEEEEEEDEEEDEPVPVLQIGNNLGEPEYDFLSRQPSEFVEETFRVVNLRPTAAGSQPVAATAPSSVPREKAAKPKRGNQGGAAASGNGAAGPSSPATDGRRPKLNPSSTLRILKTAAPALNKTPRYNPEAASIITPSPATHALEDTGLPLENLFASQPSSSLVRPSRRLPGSASGNFKNRLKNRISKDENDLQEQGGESEPVTPQATVTPQPTYGKKPGSRYRNTQIVKPVAKK